MVLYEVYKVASGHDNTAGYQTFTVEPHMPRIDPGIFRISNSKSILQDGERSGIWMWGPKVPDSVNQDVRSKCGLTSAFSALATVRLPTNADRSTWDDFNCTLFLPDEAEFRRLGWEGLVVQLLYLDEV